MEGTGPDRPGDVETPEPAAEFPGGFPGEGDDEAVLGLGRSIEETPGHPAGENGGLAGTGPGQEGQGGGLGLDGQALRSGEAPQKRAALVDGHGPEGIGGL